MKLTAALVAIIAVFLIGSTANAQQPLKVGIFDSQRITAETLEGQKIQADLSAVSEAKQQQLSTMEKEISDLQQRLEQQQLSLSVDRRTALEIDIQRRILALNNAKDLATRELQLEVAAAEAKFNEKLRLVVGQFGKSEEFDLLLEYTVVAWASPASDVTTAIIDLFNQMFPAETE
jgi:Skp family chaperone for outer membrane proteins